MKMILIKRGERLKKTGGELDMKTNRIEREIEIHAPRDQVCKA